MRRLSFYSMSLRDGKAILPELTEINTEDIRSRCFKRAMIHNVSVETRDHAISELAYRTGGRDIDWDSPFCRLDNNLYDFVEDMVESGISYTSDPIRAFTHVITRHHEEIWDLTLDGYDPVHVNEVIRQLVCGITSPDHMYA